MDKSLTSSLINDATNSRINARDYPSAPLQPLYQTRSLPTRQTKLMIESPELESTVPLHETPVYKPSEVFYPANRNAPFNGYMAAVDAESELRNINYALQKCSQATYVPDSGSDMYTLKSFTLPDHTNKQTHAMLFKEQEFAIKNVNPTSMCQGVFNNCSRQEIKKTNCRQWKQND